MWDFGSPQAPSGASQARRTTLGFWSSQENRILSIAADFQDGSDWHIQHPAELLPKTEP